MRHAGIPQLLIGLLSACVSGLAVSKQRPQLVGLCICYQRSNEQICWESYSGMKGWVEYGSLAEGKEEGRVSNGRRHVVQLSEWLPEGAHDCKPIREGKQALVVTTRQARRIGFHWFCQ